MDDSAREGIYLKIRAIQNQLMILAGKSCFLSSVKSKAGFFKIMNLSLWFEKRAPSNASTWQHW